MATCVVVYDHCTRQSLPEVDRQRWRRQLDDLSTRHAIHAIRSRCDVYGTPAQLLGHANAVLEPRDHVFLVRHRGGNKESGLTPESQNWSKR